MAAEIIGVSSDGSPLYQDLSGTLNSREGFIRKVYAAYRALAEVRCHPLAEPGVKGMQEELLVLAGVDYDEMMRVVVPGWPSAATGADE